MESFIPKGYMFPIAKEDLPIEGWTAMDGQNGTVDMRQVPCYHYNGQSYPFILPDHVWCQKD